MMDEKINLRRIRNYAKALYHNCHSAACFAYADSDSVEDNEAFTYAKQREAAAYETMATQIKGLIDKI